MSELEREMMGEWGTLVLGFEVGLPWVMASFSKWPRKVVAEEEVVLDEEIK